MKLTIQLKLLPSPEQFRLLLDTTRRFNEAASFAARQGFVAGVFSQPGIHELAYRAIRSRFGLSAQLAVRAIGKAVETFRKDKETCPAFRVNGAIVYDQRNLSFKGRDKVSLSTIEGRQTIPVVFGEHQSLRFDLIKGQCDLVCRDGQFYLFATVDAPEEPTIKAEAFLGVDLGIVNLATDSTGEAFSGEQTERNRRRHATARKQYQRADTKSAKRRLKKMAGRQSRFQRAENHKISKRLVAKAKARNLGIALEELSGIGSGADTVSKRFRRRLGNWGFHQLRAFVEYKARLAGVPVVLVDPRNTSRTCSRCGHCEKANRKSQSEFVCKQCGHSMNSDVNAALNISALGAPINCPQKSRASAQGQSPRL